MAVYDHQEQEQIEELKAWWKQYGDWVSYGLMAIVLIIAAWQGWHWWQRSQSVQASGLYSQLQQAAGQGDAKRSKELSGALIEKFPSTHYAGMGALLSAKVQSMAADGKNARAQLEWVVANGQDDGLRDIARLRLAAVLSDDGAYDDALKVLDVEPLAEFKPRFLDGKADVYVAMGKPDEARRVYAEVLSLLKSQESSADAERRRRIANFRELIQAKTDGLSSISAAGIGSAK